MANNEFSIVFIWKDKSFKCSICNLWIDEREKQSHFLSNSHERNIINISKLEHRLAWKNLAKALELINGSINKICSVTIPHVKKKFTYILKQIRHEEKAIENNDFLHKVGPQLQKSLPVVENINADILQMTLNDEEIEKQLQTVLEISKREYDNADMQMFQIQLNAIEFKQGIEHFNENQLCESLAFVCVDE